MAEVDQYIAQRKAEREQIDAILTEAGLDEPSISYELQGKPILGRERYYEAHQELAAMINGQQPLNLKRAVFLVESAYNPNLTWKWFDDQIENMVQHVGAVMQQRGISRQDQVAKNMALFQFFTDTLTVERVDLERKATSFPMFYDFEDFWGREDYSKQFVSKLMQTGTGQCHSLPLLYLILADEMDIDAHLAFSPSHSYVKFQDQIGNWHNMELTNHVLTSDQFVMHSGFVKSEAMMNQVYMHPLSKEELIGSIVMDLASGYVKRFGYERFVTICSRLAMQTGLKSMAIHQHNFNYYMTLHQYVLNQYKQYGLTRQDFEADEQAMHIYTQLVGADKYIDKMGYVDMPEDQYEAWLNSVQEERRKQEHRNRLRQLTQNH